MTYFSITAMEGNSFINGITLGVGEGAGNLMVPFLLKYISDKYVFISGVTVCGIFNIIF